MLRDNGTARVNVVPNPAAPKEDPFLAAVQHAAASDFVVLGEIGRGKDGVIIYLAREVSTRRLIALRLQREGELTDEFTLEVVRHLDNSMPAPDSKCFKCGQAIRGWARFCSFCGVDLSGAAPAAGDANGSAAMLAALSEAVADEYEVLGEMARSEGGGAVYFARDRASNRIVALRLQREGGDDGFSVGETTALKPLAASLGVKPVATQLLGALVPQPGATTSKSRMEPAPVAAPPPLRSVPPPPPRVRSISRRTQLILGAVGAVVLAFVLMLLLMPDQGGPSGAAATSKAVATKPVPPPPPPPPPAAAVQSETPPPPPAVATPPAPSHGSLAAAPVPRATTGTIAVTLVGDDADVQIDGTKWFPNRPRTLRAGSHTVAVSVPGYLPHSVTVALEAGQKLDVPMHLEPIPKPPAKAAPTPEVPKKSGQDQPRPPAVALVCDKLMQDRQWSDAINKCTIEAASGSAVAKRNLGLLYERGDGVKASKPEAVRWYREASTSGDAIAAYLLGTYYENGGGDLKKDPAKAVQQYTAAAEGGYALAQRTVAEIYEKGHLGQAKNDAKAFEWYSKAAAQGDKDAAKKIKDHH